MTGANKSNILLKQIGRIEESEGGMTAKELDEEADRIARAAFGEAELAKVRDPKPCLPENRPPSTMVQSARIMVLKRGWVLGGKTSTQRKLQ